MQRRTIFLIVLVAMCSPALVGLWMQLFKFYGLSIGFAGYVKLVPGTLLMMWSVGALRTASNKVLLSYVLVVAVFGALAFGLAVVSGQASGLLIFLSVAAMYTLFINLPTSCGGLVGVCVLSFVLGPLIAFAKLLEFFYKEVLL